MRAISGYQDNAHRLSIGLPGYRTARNIDRANEGRRSSSLPLNSALSFFLSLSLSLSCRFLPVAEVA